VLGPADAGLLLLGPLADLGLEDQLRSGDIRRNDERLRDFAVLTEERLQIIPGLLPFVEGSRPVFVSTRTYRVRICALSLPPPGQCLNGQTRFLSVSNGRRSGQLNLAENILAAENGP
jgi:hypothetical protein